MPGRLARAGRRELQIKPEKVPTLRIVARSRRNRPRPPAGWRLTIQGRRADPVRVRTDSPLERRPGRLGPGPRAASYPSHVSPASGTCKPPCEASRRRRRGQHPCQWRRLGACRRRAGPAHTWLPAQPVSGPGCQATWRCQCRWQCGPGQGPTPRLVVCAPQHPITAHSPARRKRGRTRKDKESFPASTTGTISAPAADSECHGHGGHGEPRTRSRRRLARGSAAGAGPVLTVRSEARLRLADAVARDSMPRIRLSHCPPTRCLPDQRHCLGVGMSWPGPGPLPDGRRRSSRRGHFRSRGLSRKAGPGRRRPGRRLTGKTGSVTRDSVGLWPPGPSG